METIGEYALLPLKPDTDYKPLTLILETSVVIDIERFFYAPSLMPDGRRRSVRDLLVKYHGIDMIPGFGIAEASWAWPTTTVQPKQWTSLAHAFDSIWAWSEEEIRAHSMSPKSIQSSGIATSSSDASPFALAGNILLPSYATLLKLQVISKRPREGNAFRLFRELIEWANEELELVFPYEIQLAADYFLGEPADRDYVQKLMKFGKKDSLSATRSAAWDILFLRWMDFSQSGAFATPVPAPKLVTADQGLIGLRERCSLHAVVSSPEPLGLVDMILKVRPALHRFSEELTSVWGAVFRSQTARLMKRLTSRRDPTTHPIQKCLGIAADLERQLIHANDDLRTPLTQE
jgi:hypothetical protein